MVFIFLHVQSVNATLDQGVINRWEQNNGWIRL